jgi:putative FmdB family regulatory protein
MPIYEYECATCAKISSHVVMGSRRRLRLACPACGAARLKRVMSSFAVVSSEASRLAEFDTSRPRDESFYRDSRNVGLWAKKRAKEMGADLGTKFEETVEKARSGKLVKEIL